MNDPIAQLEASKPVIKNLLGDLLIEKKDLNNSESFVEQTIENGDKELTDVYFNSNAQAVKGNVKDSDNKCIIWCHIINLNPLKTHPERIGKENKNMANDLDYKVIKFRMSKKNYFVMKIIQFIL